MPKQLGAPTEPCALNPNAAIWVHVVDDRGVDVGKVRTSKDGAEKPTAEDSGTARYEPVAPGKHTVDLVLSADDLTRYEKPALPTTRPIQVAAGEIAYVPYQLARKPSLKVKVFEKGKPEHLFANATVTVTGPENPAAKPTVSGIADFPRITSGNYAIKVKLSAEDEKTFATTLDFTQTQEPVELFPGREQEVAIEVEPINIVTPKIELEYRIVLLDRKLSDKQGAEEAKILPSATYIQATITQSNPAHPYAGTGKLKFSDPKVDVFTNEACTEPLLADLTTEQLIGTSDQIVGPKPPRFWLRGKDKGRFTVDLVLADPANRFIKIAPDLPPPQKMGVVELELKLHHQDLATLKGAGMQVDPNTDPESTYYTNLNSKLIPDQLLMTAEEKIGVPTHGDAAKPGRLLHAQHDAHFGRARLVVAKIDIGQLPEEAEVDDYDIVLNVGRGWAPNQGAEALKTEELQGGAKDTPKTGAIALFDAEFDGAKKDKVTYKVSALKAAEQTIWVEGTTETDQPCDLRLDAGMDRTAGGLQKFVKRNGDWTRYTVVKIEEVKLDYTASPGKAVAWDGARKEFYINLEAEPAGRKVTIAAKLTKPLKNVVLHFMLAPDKGNRKAANWGVDMPATWKWKDLPKDIKHVDKADVGRKDFLHVSEKTGDDGKAKKELTLSRIGGDVFWPAAYIEQDAHFAKYADFEGFPELKKRKPVTSTDEIKVWRKFWYQMLAIDGRVNPGIDPVIAQYERAKVRVEKADDVPVGNAATVSMFPSVYPRYMFERNGGNAPSLVISNMNKDDFFSPIQPAADKPVKIPLVICDFQWDSDEYTDLLQLNWTQWDGLPLPFHANKKIVKPPLQGGALIDTGARISTRRPIGGGPGWASGPSHEITDNDVVIDPARVHFNKFKIKLPAALEEFMDENPDGEIRVTPMRLQAAAGVFLGEWSRSDRTLLAVTDPNAPIDSQNSIAHELGHAFEMVPGKEGAPKSSATEIQANTLPAHIPQHPNAYFNKGWHCNNGVDTCVMYHTNVAEGHSIGHFCDVCHPYLLVRNMSQTNKPG
ncbi:MAG TPA: hypothetical protein PK359_07325 [Burkholderiaceae bacterium]|nr:hypothetical protein [Burkholderiaceae bacterium]